MLKFNASIKQFQPKKLVSGDLGCRILLEVSVPDKITLDGLSELFVSQSNLTENIIVTME